MAILTTDITYKGQSGDLASSIFFEPILKHPALQTLGFDIREDIISYEDMYQVYAGDKATKKKTTCGWNPSGSIAELRDKRITVQELAIELEQCAKDFDGKILQIAKKKGINRNDLTGTQLESIMVEIVKEIAHRDMLRIIFLGDTANASADYNQFDGIWKKIQAGVAGATINKGSVVIADTLAADSAKNILDELHFDVAPIELQAMEEASKVKLVTRSLYNNYLQYLANNNQLESSWSVLQNGTKTLTHYGVPLVATDIVDQYLKVDFNTAGDIENPHRAIYTVPENITIGTDQVSDFQTVDFWYEKKPQMNHLRVEYKLGVSLGWDNLFAVNY